jgi:hypothetical protein
MEKLLWYIGLAIMGVVTTAFTIYKKRDTYKVSTLFVFLLFTACVTWIGEFIVLGLLNSYAYKTGVFSDPWAQNLLGHLIINTTLYPAVAIVMVAYSLRYGWMLLVATVFTLIEYLFVQLRIYEQHWWRYYMTFIAVIMFLLIFHKWFPKMNEKRYGLTRAITFYFIAIITIHTPAPILLLLGKQYYQVSLINSLVGNLYLSSIIIIFFYHMFEAFLCVVCTCVFKKWYSKVILVSISITAQIIFTKMNILIIADNWSLVYTLFIYGIFTVAYIFIESHTLRPNLYRFER